MDRRNDAQDDNETARDLLLCTLAGMHAEDRDLLGWADDDAAPAPALRANERAVGARLAVHVDRLLRPGGLPRADIAGLVADVENSHVLMGVKPKEGPKGRIYADLIVHSRGSTDRNLLVVELKPGVPHTTTTIDRVDDG